jgi:hypothetical protein
MGFRNQIERKAKEAIDIVGDGGELTPVQKVCYVASEAICFIENDWYETREDLHKLGRAMPNLVEACKSADRWQRENLQHDNLID